MKSITLKCLLIIAIFALCGSRALASASVNVPLDSPLYGDIETLSARGLIKSNLSSSRPFTRAEAGRLLAEAILNHEKGKSQTIDKLLSRLAKDYGNEIAEAEMEGTTPPTYLKPIDEFSVSYNFLDGPYSVFNNEGIDYYDGHNTMAQFQSRGRLWNVFSFYIQPMFFYNQRHNGIDGNDETEFRLHKGYIKFTVDDFEIAVGRDSMWWGPGYHGSLLMSNNAKPFDMIKISNPRATLLPWIFSYLGPFRYNLLFSRLDDDEHKIADKSTGDDLSKPYLYGLRFDFKPHPLVEVGLSHLVLFGGEGRDLSFADFFRIAYSNKNRDHTELESNQQFAIDLALTLPNVRTLVPLADSIKLYGELGAEDTGTPPDRRAYLAGIAFNNAFLVKGLQLRAEYADLSPGSVPASWYSHGSYPMTYSGRVFGHHAGTNADDLFFELSQDFSEELSCKAGFDRERSGISRPDTEEKYQWFLETGYNVTKGASIMIRYSYEEIKNHNNVEGSKEKNHFIGCKYTFTF